MDRIALEILHEGLKQDAAVIQIAATLARKRLEQQNPGHLAACGFELHRLYNVLEKSFERVCEAFENHFEKRGDYHEKLIERMTLSLPEIRPSFLPSTLRGPVRELKAFRHVFRHAYDLEFRPDRLKELVDLAQEIGTAFPKCLAVFVEEVRRKLS